MKIAHKNRQSKNQILELQLLTVILHCFGPFFSMVLFLKYVDDLYVRCWGYMMNNIKQLLLMATLLLLSSCATSNHGTFITSTYINPSLISEEAVGKISGESKQTWLFYIFPIGKAPSTDEAIIDAKLKIEGTKFLSDLSVDDRIYWKFGYKEQVIEVSATAHK